MDRRTRIRWDRLGRWALIGVFALVLYLYIGPAAHAGSRPTARPSSQRAEVAALRAENARLRARQRDAAARRSALEREARRLGMVKAGERAYVVEGLPASRSASLASACRSRPRVEQWEAGMRRLDEALPGAARRRSSA